MKNKNKEDEITYKIILRKIPRTIVSRLKLPTKNTAQWVIEDLHQSISSRKFRGLGTSREDPTSSQRRKKKKKAYTKKQETECIKVSQWSCTEKELM